jgi:uncharacterized membrane protein YraQ (UPF0718 family)
MKKIINKKLENSIKKSAKGIFNSLPMIFSVILLISLLDILIPIDSIKFLFNNNNLDVIIGSIIGSVSAGSAITSYIIGGELLDIGINMVAITAFLVAWVTVGVIQLPAEAFLLGNKFAITRNIVCFIFSIIVAITTILLVNII